ncbi:MAG: hypothetical protein ACJA0G_002292, partial [Kangiellaceae bacterium]
FAKALNELATEKAINDRAAVLFIIVPVSVIVIMYQHLDVIL